MSVCSLRNSMLGEVSAIRLEADYQIHEKKWAFINAMQTKYSSYWVIVRSGVTLHLLIPEAFGYESSGIVAIYSTKQNALNEAIPLGPDALVQERYLESPRNVDLLSWYNIDTPIKGSESRILKL